MTPFSLWASRLGKRVIGNLNVPLIFDIYFFFAVMGSLVAAAWLRLLKETLASSKASTAALHVDMQTLALSSRPSRRQGALSQLLYPYFWKIFCDSPTSLFTSNFGGLVLYVLFSTAAW